jgi:hypothetical protein
MTQTATQPATDKQVAFIAKLIDERLAKKADGTYGTDTVATVVAAREGGIPEYLVKVQAAGKKAASITIDRLLAAPKKPKAPRPTGGVRQSHQALHDTGECFCDDPTGAKARAKAEAAAAPSTGYADVAKKGDVHVVDGEYLRVHISQRTGHAYANKAVILETARWDGDTLVKAGKVKWEYAPGVIKRLSVDTFATADEAAAFGKMVGRCCFCSTPIDTKESIAAGYGPVCAANRGLPWGDAKTDLTGEINAAPDILSMFEGATVIGGEEA